MIVVNILRRFEVHSTLLVAFLCLLHQFAAPEDMPVGVDFEVYGRVQGVFFRKFTQSKAKELGLSGWCMNTDHNTVVGYVEGEKGKVEEMKNWLRTTGSPQSAIDKAEFRNEKQLDMLTLDSFTIKKK
ncbi:acylphosphatase-1 [Trichogramma pretiosum]|uniref:acylphosphatase n=1 Tax=Trichogramma kaykai TaxID=54128 RepID=A0ABD2WPD2_9HYME|nr:acylphosphatase-1 [Trichogramma pretiosum]